MPRRLDMEPAAMLRTMTSSGTICTFFTSVSRSDTSSMKCVGTPASSNLRNIKSDMRLLTTPFPVMVPFFSPLNAVASSL